MSSFYDRQDVLDVALGSFQGMAGVDIKNKVKVAREGKTFAVMAVFPYLSLTRFIMNGSDFNKLVTDMDNLKSDLAKPIEVILPSPQASKLSGLTRVSALGGAEHELGHILIDMGGSYLPSAHELRSRGVEDTLTRFRSHANFEKIKKSLHTWVNVLADVRLERFMGALYEPTRSRFHAIQSWVHTLEQEGRESGQMGLGGSIMCLIRDLGKGWTNPDQRQVIEQYKKLYPQSWELVMDTKAIWEKVIPKADSDEDDIAKSVHLPLVVAMELLMALSEKIELPPPPPQPKDKKGKKGEKGEKGEKGDDGDDGDGGDDGDENSKGYGGKGKITDSYQLNEGKALDPSSAMEKAISEAEKTLDHKVYYDGKMQEKRFSWADTRG